MPARALKTREPPIDDDGGIPDWEPGTVPASDSAERAVLGAMLLDGSLVDTVAAHINPDDFWDPRHEQIAKAILKVHQSGQGVEPVAVSDQLLSSGQLGNVRGPYLFDLLQAAAPANVEHHAGIVRDHSRHRQALQTVVKLNQALQRPGAHHNPDLAIADAMDELDRVAMRLGPSGASSNELTGLASLDWVADGSDPPVPPQPAWVEVDGGGHLFYPGAVNCVFGDPEHGKSWLAQIAGIEAMRQGGKFALVDVDYNGAEATVMRMLALGAHPRDLASLDTFRYYAPDGADQLRSAIADLRKWGPDVLVLDSLGELFPMLGVSTNDADEVTNAMREVLAGPAKDGCCVITIDHLPKAGEARESGTAIGSMAKKRMARGLYLRAQARVKPIPGHVGYISLRIDKDTHGQVRKASGGDLAGTLVLDSTAGDDRVSWRIERETPMVPSSDGTPRPTRLMERVSRFVEVNDQCSAREIRTSVGGRSASVDMALHVLILEGFIALIAGPRGTKLHHSLSAYRESEDVG